MTSTFPSELSGNDTSMYFCVVSSGTNIKLDTVMGIRHGGCKAACDGSSRSQDYPLPGLLYVQAIKTPKSSPFRGYGSSQALKKHGHTKRDPLLGGS